MLHQIFYEKMPSHITTGMLSLVVPEFIPIWSQWTELQQIASNVKLIRVIVYHQNAIWKKTILMQLC